MDNDFIVYLNFIFLLAIGDDDLFDIMLLGFFSFNGISTLFRLFNAKAILIEEQ